MNEFTAFVLTATVGVVMSTRETTDKGSRELMNASRISYRVVRLRLKQK